MQVVVFAGQGDPRRSMALLWRGTGPGERGEEPRRRSPGPKPGLSVDVIVDAGIAVADEEGMSALSMRAVGERLGRTGMALYTYIPNKSELVDVMYDRAMAELPAEYDLQAGWRAALTAWAGDTRDFCLRHPWTLQVSQARPVLGPHEFAALESLLRILHATGLAPRVLRGIVGGLFHFVHGAARTVAEARQAAAATGMSDTEWWSARAGQMEEVAPDFAERFPMAVWIESDSATPPEDASTPYLELDAQDNFDVGLGVLLDGIEARVRAAGRA
jgi:AcrR family transcriptional regulator